jgi:adenylate cyclase class 2
MNYEVEQKFRTEHQAVTQALESLGAVWGTQRVECDTYYAHPARDFAATDEALRIRRVDTACCITYKGPKIDATTKTRRELELPIPADQAEAWAELLSALGFRPAGEVRKRRRKAKLPWEDRLVEIALDEVEGLGTFVELEIVADAPALDAARACLASLAAQLHLTDSERRSYLELIREPFTGWGSVHSNVSDSAASPPPPVETGEASGGIGPSAGG